MVYFRSLAFLGSTALGLVAAAPAQAQTTQPDGASQTSQDQPAASTAPGQLADIIVTAERTSSSVQKTPISIAVV
jgi:hypothetical protein